MKLPYSSNLLHIPTMVPYKKSPTRMQHLRGRAWHRRDNPEWLEDSAVQLYGVSGFRVLGSRVVRFRVYNASGLVFWSLGFSVPARALQGLLVFRNAQCLHNLFRTDNGVAEGF